MCRESREAEKFGVRDGASDSCPVYWNKLLYSDRCSLAGRFETLFDRIPMNTPSDLLSAVPRFSSGKQRQADVSSSHQLASFNLSDELLETSIKQGSLFGPLRTILYKISCRRIKPGGSLVGVVGSPPFRNPIST